MIDVTRMHIILVVDVYIAQ